MKSHILPQAFTKPSVSGEPLFQSSRRRGFVRRWSSWYDARLVTRRGEDILSEIDDRAIKLMRRHQLTWGSWVIYKPHFEVISPAMPTHSYRELALTELEAAALNLFFISVAWRVSATSIPDFEDVKFPASVEEDLRRAMTNPEADDWKKYPASLIQMTTKGEKHNHSPFISKKNIPAYDDQPAKGVSFLRIFLDGLIVHFHFAGYPDERSLAGPLFVGGGRKVGVIGVSYEASFQYENMLVNLMETFAPDGS